MRRTSITHWLHQDAHEQPIKPVAIKLEFSEQGTWLELGDEFILLEVKDGYYQIRHAENEEVEALTIRQIPIRPENQ
jgi:hypothetical protein